MKTNTISEILSQDKQHEPKAKQGTHKKKSNVFLECYQHIIEHRDLPNKNNPKNKKAINKNIPVEATNKKMLADFDLSHSEYFKKKSEVKSSHFSSLIKNTKLIKDPVHKKSIKKETKKRSNIKNSEINSIIKNIKSLKKIAKDSKNKSLNTMEKLNTQHQKSYNTSILPHQIKQKDKGAEASTKATGFKSKTIKEDFDIQGNIKLSREEHKNAENKILQDKNSSQNTHSIKTIANHKDNHESLGNKPVSPSSLGLNANIQASTQQKLTSTLAFTHTTPIHALLATHIANGRSHFVINLHPRDLGDVKIHISKNGGNHVVKLEAEIRSTENILMNECATLESTLKSKMPKVTLAIMSSQANNSEQRKLKTVKRATHK